MPAIRTDHLTRTFGPVTAVDSLSLDVNEGEIFGLVGPDGAGKTTTLRLLAALLDPTSGDAWIADYHTRREPEAIKDHIGYMSQRFGLYHDLSVLENIHFYAYIYGVPRKDRTDRVERLLAFSHLTPFKKRLAGDLSGGMKQKLGLACALIHTPRILLLDEPTSGVDPVSRRDFWRILYQLLFEKVTILITTAYLDEAERCSRLALLHQGRLLACGTPADVKNLMRGTILELRTPQPRRTIQLLRTALAPARGTGILPVNRGTGILPVSENRGTGVPPAGVAGILPASGTPVPPVSISLFGDRIHIVTADPARTAAAVRDTLARAGLPPAQSQPIPPTLEDVFISVIASPPSPSSSSSSSLSSSSSSDPSDQSDPSDLSDSSIAPAPMPARAPAQPAVSVRNLERRFGRFIAVNRISLDIAPGEIFGFLGPNGAGKSTTIRMLCGILRPTSGSATVAGFDLTRPEQVKSRIGYMSQKFSLYEDLTVEENIDFYSGIYRIPSGRKADRKDWVIHMAGLAEHRRSKTADLSGGWKQRLALGCAILHEPPVLFLDEPTSGVDPISRRKFWDLIYELASRGVTIFVTTHYMDEAEYCDRVGLIYRGELIAQGTPRSLKESLATPTLEDVFVSLIESHDRARRPEEDVER